MTDKVFPLSKPIHVHGKNGAEEARSICLRAPLGADLFDLGVPVNALGFTDFKALGRWVERLAGPQAGSVGEMAARDVKQVIAWLNGLLSARTKRPEKLAANIFPLSNPVALNGKTIAQVELRPPCADALFELGVPVTSVGMVDFAAARVWLNRLAGEQAEALGKALPADVVPMIQWLERELSPEDEGSDNAPADEDPAAGADPKN